MEKKQIQMDFDLPVPGKLKASAGFADRVMEQIAEETHAKTVRLPLVTRIGSVAAMALICISLGFLLGSQSHLPALDVNKVAKKESLEQFRDNYHLYSVREADLMMYPVNN